MNFFEGMSCLSCNKTFNNCSEADLITVPASFNGSFTTAVQ